MKRMANAASRSGLPLLLTAATILFAHGVAADLVGRDLDRAVVISITDDALVAANPLLEQLGREHPQLLREVLKRLRTPMPKSLRRRQEQDSPETEIDGEILEENPDLNELYRSSPEAFLDLLRLIREATEK